MSGLVTGEAVVVELDAARVPSRGIAFVIDATIQLLLGIAAAYLTTRAADQLDGAATAAVVLTITVLLLVGYPVVWETLTRGRTPGKAAMGLRVVRDDGGPVRFRHSFVRALLAVFVDLWMTMGTVGLVASLSSVRGKRVGDVLAGTFVVRDRVRQRGLAVPVMPAPLASWAATLDLTRLPDDLALAARQYLSRVRELDPVARESTGVRLADAVAAVVSPAPPAGVPAQAYLAAVVAERRRREQERLTGQGAVPVRAPAGGQDPFRPPSYDARGADAPSYGGSGSYGASGTSAPSYGVSAGAEPAPRPEPAPRTPPQGDPAPAPDNPFAPPT